MVLLVTILVKIFVMLVTSITILYDLLPRGQAFERSPDDHIADFDNNKSSWHHSDIILTLHSKNIDLYGGNLSVKPNGRIHWVCR